MRMQRQRSSSVDSFSSASPYLTSGSVMEMVLPEVPPKPIPNDCSDACFSSVKASRSKSLSANISQIG